MPKALIDLSENELKDLLRAEAKDVDYSYNGIRDELERRAGTRQSRAALVVAFGSFVVAVAALILALR